MSNITKVTGSSITPAAARALAAYQSARGIAIPTTGNLVILADCSGSMREEAGKGKNRREVMIQALSDLWPELPNAKLYGFNSDLLAVPHPSKMPHAYGGTYLARAMAGIGKPSGVLIVSDGVPDSREDAFAAARRLAVPISVLFIGDPTDSEAIAFMNQLAKLTGGKCEAKDLKKLGAPLASTIRGLLPK